MCARAQRRSRMQSNEDDGDVVGGGGANADADDVKDEPREEVEADGVVDDAEGVVNVPRRARTGA